MQWTMPPRVIQIVAGFLAFISVAAFAMGVFNAPARGRLPGERAGPAGAATAAAPLNAPEAIPLSQDRIEGPPPTPELTPEEKAKQEADKQAKAEASAAARAQAATQATTAAPQTPAPILQIPEPTTPPADEAPH